MYSQRIKDKDFDDLNVLEDIEKYLRIVDRYHGRMTPLRPIKIKYTSIIREGRNNLLRLFPLLQKIAKPFYIKPCKSCDKYFGEPMINSFQYGALNNIEFNRSNLDNCDDCYSTHAKTVICDSCKLYKNIYKVEFDEDGYSKCFICLGMEKQKKYTITERFNQILELVHHAVNHDIHKCESCDNEFFLGKNSNFNCCHRCRAINFKCEPNCYYCNHLKGIRESEFCQCNWNCHTKALRHFYKFNPKKVHSYITETEMSNPGLIYYIVVNELIKKLKIFLNRCVMNKYLIMEILEVKWSRWFTSSQLIEMI